MYFDLLIYICYVILYTNQKFSSSSFFLEVSKNIGKESCRRLWGYKIRRKTKKKQQRKRERERKEYEEIFIIIKSAYKKRREKKKREILKDI